MNINEMAHWPYKQILVDCTGLMKVQMANIYLVVQLSYNISIMDSYVGTRFEGLYPKLQGVQV